MEKQLEKILRRVQKPGRYSGGEWNAVRKDWQSTYVKMAFAFPDVYEVGMSHLGLQILYGMVNDREDALLERVFAPWPDMEEQMRNTGLPLFSLESRRPLRDFDIIGFTLQYELSFTNILNMLDLAGIPPRSADRAGGDYPLVVAGGPCAFNPEPIADFIDVFVIGEGEETLNDLLDAYLASRRNGEARQDLLLRLARFDGIYVPTLYRVEYNNHRKGTDGRRTIRDQYQHIQRPFATCLNQKTPTSRQSEHHQAKLPQWHRPNAGRHGTARPPKNCPPGRAI